MKEYDRRRNYLKKREEEKRAESYPAEGVIAIEMDKDGMMAVGLGFNADDLGWAPTPHNNMSKQQKGLKVRKTTESSPRMTAELDPNLIYHSECYIGKESTRRKKGIFHTTEGDF